MALSVEDQFRQAIASLDAGKLEDAELHFGELLRREPKHLAALNLLGIVLTHLQKYDAAESCLRSALDINSNSDVTFYNYGIILKALKRPVEALDRFSQALAINSKVAETWNNRATVFNDLKRYDDAIADSNKAISLNENYSDAYSNKGKSLFATKRYDEALATYDKLLALNPGSAEPLLGRGNVLAALERRDEALAAYDKTLAVRPDLAEAWLGRGNIFYDIKQYDEALAAYDKALVIKPDLAESWLGRGNVFADLNRHSEALAAYDKSLALKPDLANAWLGRGNAFRNIRRYVDAFAAYDRALEFDPELANAWLGRGNIFYDLKRYDEAFDAFDRAVKLSPDLIGAEGMRLSASMYECNWKDFEEDVEHLLSCVRRGVEVAPPFLLLAIPSFPSDQLKCARRWTAIVSPPAKSTVWQGERYNHERIRIAYVSSDFRSHPMSYLIAGFIEAQNRDRFELTGISLQPEESSEIGQRMKRAFDRFIDVSSKTDDEVARLMRELEIDIAVDLNGHTRNSRTNIFARRAAPLQVSYMGFPGTMGANYIDYVIADRTVIPTEESSLFAEKIVWMPDTYWVADQKLGIAKRTPSRSEVNLPDGAFIFCCFNQTYKILPSIFDSWIRILKEVDGSVLWLLEDSTTAGDNLRREAVSGGVSPSRLIFASRMPLPDHLARHRCADLFLDTVPYNGHTTASDALWAGLPVLTQIGQAFAGRVAASLLTAIGLSELITATPQAYEQLAVELALSPEKLAAVKAKLAENRLTKPLFDTRLFTRHIESGYATMYARYREGLPPDHISIPH